MGDYGFSIQTCTPGFTALSGPLAVGQRLCDWLSHDDSGKLTDWLQEIGNAAGKACGGIIIRTPSSTRAGLEYIVDRVTIDQLSFADEDRSIMQARIVLCGVFAKHQRKTIGRAPT